MGQKGEGAAIPKAGWLLLKGGPWGPTVCHCESWWFLLFLFLLRLGLETPGGGVAAPGSLLGLRGCHCSSQMIS